tara:strand:+ start:416 stop:1342 length:927 start_codon:yes stop_codon:yes gene_type:complete
LIVGSNGLVGSSISNVLEDSKNNFNIIKSTRSDTDLFSYKETEKLIKNTMPDVLVIAAARVGGIIANNTKRVEFLTENLKINLNLLEACSSFKDIKIINLGSSCIYPLNAENPIKEDSYMTGLLEPTNSPYAMAKLTAIELGRSLGIQKGHKVINLMPTNLYGPNDNFSDRYSHVIPGLINRMHEAKLESKNDLEIWGSGKPLREFLYVDDLAKAIEFIIVNNIETDLLNIGSGEEVSIKELAETIKSVVSYEGNLVFNTEKPDGNPRKLLDSTLINNLGWKSETTLQDGLVKTYSWYKDNYDLLRRS